jgi:ElaB/YqjD/DUF883 family membrane-anchored ribosome-binding protein
MIEPIPTKTPAREQLLNDIKTVISEAEQWLRSGSQLTGEELAAAKAKLERTLSTAKDDLVRMEQVVVERGKEAARITDEYVHENPWKSVLIGAAVGLAAGVIIARR